MHTALVKALDAELQATHGLPLTSYEVLITLRDGARPQAPDGRARRLACCSSRSGMTRLVDRLERDGLLERDNCDSDARGFFAVLTPKGEELLATARRTHLDGVRERFLRPLRGRRSSR